MLVGFGEGQSKKNWLKRGASEKNEGKEGVRTKKLN